ncbi:MAG: transposase, partial [Magnetococcales bacterium]|nr:transposase [Magnetococcales bacterium]
MKTKTLSILTHLLGEGLATTSSPVAVDTFGGRLHVEWDPQAAVTPLGQLPFFIEFLKTADLFEPWVEESPLEYKSPNAPSKRDVLGTMLLSI